ncbi:Putative inorganic phosphate cotransporter [Frankliniella fusca]|uniref:Putative inorganic phosphate cotransporter n=1 Tax=Frankliniella fusca TaxID=407009 RepID=A0AAE1HD92_9NEOP|nr:Putative inorganic phosphate cotransporter [Frankliniella fusca]
MTAISLSRSGSAGSRAGVAAAAQPAAVTDSTEVLVAPAKLRAFGIRHLQCLMSFLCFVQAYIFVSCISVAIVAMKDDPDLMWSDSHQSIVLSAFLWGFCVSPMLGGQLAQRFGPKAVMGVSLLLSSTGSLLLPAAATLGGWQFACAVRVLQGLFQGVLAPATHALLAKWVPPFERSRLGSFVYGGAQFGTVLGLLLTGLLSGSSWGWPSVFYVAGSTGLLWCLSWYLLGDDSPATHHSIPKEEREYIEKSTTPADNSGATKVVSTPWVQILSSLPVWGLTAAHCGQMVGYWTLLTQLPNYMKNVQNYAIADNGMVSALPYFTMWLAALPMSFVSDALIKKGFLSTTAMRKIANTIAQWGGAVMLAVMGTGVNDDSPFLTVLLLTLSMTLLAAMYLGFQINHLDLSPNHAPALMGFTNLWANLLSVLGPIVTPLIVTDPTNAAQWHIVFLAAAGTFVVANALFLLIGTAEQQPWNELGLEPATPPTRRVSPLATISLTADELRAADMDAKLKDIS